jgi:hypothetical protein
MASRPEITGRRSGTSVARAAYTIPEFCEAHRISESTYYNLKSKGLGPRELDAGRKIITFEAAAEWRAADEVETTTETAA